MINEIAVPHLFKIKTKVADINGFLFFDINKFRNKKLFFYQKKTSQHIPTYSYEIKRNINIPKKFDFLYRWCRLYDKKIYYERPIIKNFSIKFIYDLTTHKLTVNPAYHHLIPFELGNIWPSGKILSNFIAYDLQKLKFGTFHGMAFKYNKNVVCIFAPGGNFKTPLLKALIAKGATYISGDKLIIKDSYVYFMPPLKNDKTTIKYNKMQTYKYKITNIFFMFRSKNITYNDLGDINIINSYLTTFSLFNFLGNGWALNFRKIIDTYVPINNWYDFLNLKQIRSVKIIREDNFVNLVNYFIKELK